MAQGVADLRVRRREPRIDALLADGLPSNPEGGVGSEPAAQHTVEDEQMDGDRLDGLRRWRAVMLRGVRIEQERTGVRVRGQRWDADGRDRGRQEQLSCRLGAGQHGGVQTPAGRAGSDVRMHGSIATRKAGDAPGTAFKCVHV